MAKKRRPVSVTRALKRPDKPGAGAKKRRRLSPKNKTHAIMAEFKGGTLRSGSGKKVTKRSQAIAIAMNESGQRKRKRRKKR